MSVVIVNTDDKMINSATQEARERRTFSHTREDMSREMMSASVSIKIGVNYFSEKERERERSAHCTQLLLQRNERGGKLECPNEMKH